MSITARDIQEQGFEDARKGYDKEEVDIFLERVATEVDALTRQNQELRARVAEMANRESVAAPAAAAPVDDSALVAAQQQAATFQQQAADYQRRMTASDAEVASLKKQLEQKGEDASAISAAIISAQKSADTIREEARAEGEKIYREAENKAREIVRDALANKQQTLTELDHLRKSRDSFRSEYQSMLDRFSVEANKEFEDLDDGESGPMPEEEVVAQERQAIDEMRANASRKPAAPAPAPAPVPTQQTMPIQEPAVKPAYPAPAAATTQMPPVQRDMSTYGDTADDFDVEEID